MDFLINNLELITVTAGGITIGGIVFFSKYKRAENDLTQIYVRYKKHSDNINKSAKTIL